MGVCVKRGRGPPEEMNYDRSQPSLLQSCVCNSFFELIEAIIIVLLQIKPHLKYSQLCTSESLVGCHLWGRTESDTTEVT